MESGKGIFTGFEGYGKENVTEEQEKNMQGKGGDICGSTTSILSRLYIKKQPFMSES